MHLQFVGCGDAFGSGGRATTCFHLVGARTNVLIDCGASSPPALNRIGIDSDPLDAILVTHFHAYHFSGVPFLVLEAEMVKKRTRPLLLAGPPGIQQRYETAMEAAFPGSPSRPERFELTFLEIAAGERKAVGALDVAAFAAVHTEAAGPCLGYRIEAEGRVIAFSGDTEWTPDLVPLGREADLFICETYTRERIVRHHTALATLERHLAEIRPKRLVLTHMSADMLAHVAAVPHETATDGMVVAL